MFDYQIKDGFFAIHIPFLSFYCIVNNGVMFGFNVFNTMMFEFNSHMKNKWSVWSPSDYA
jgi:hypothetical protein